MAGAAVFQVEELRPPQELASRLREELPAATTGSDGRFSLADRPRGLPVHLFVLARRFLPATVRGVRPPAASPLRIRLAVGARYAGRVLDLEGLPIANAKVALDWRQTAPGREDLLVGRPVSKTATTGSDGRFELADLPQGKGRLAASATGFVTVEGIAIALPQAPGEEKTVVLARGRDPWRGRSRRRRAAPVPTPGWWPARPPALSDRRGAFRTEEVPTGPVLVEVSPPPLPAAPQASGDRAGGQPDRGGLRSGYLRRGAAWWTTRAPRCPARWPSSSRCGAAGLSYQAATDAEGAFTLEPVTAGVYRLRASARGHIDAAALQPGEGRKRKPVEGLGSRSAQEERSAARSWGWRPTRSRG